MSTPAPVSNASASLDPRTQEAIMRLNPQALAEALSLRALVERDQMLARQRTTLQTLLGECDRLQGQRDDLINTARARGSADAGLVTASVDQEIARVERLIAEIKRTLDHPPKPTVQFGSGEAPLVLDLGGDDLSAARDNPIVARELQRSQAGTATARVGGQLREQIMNAGPVKQATQRPVATILLGLILLIAAIMFQPSVASSGVAVTPTPASNTTPAPRAATPTPPAPATPTPMHQGLPAPARLVVNLGTVNLDLAINPADWVAIGADTRAIFPPSLTPGAIQDQRLVHYGAYPGEDDNLVLLGTWDGFGEQIQNLQLNDQLIVTSRSGRKYIYAVIPCGSAGARACATAKDETWPLGHTPGATLTLLASRSDRENYVVRARYVTYSDN